MKTKNRLNLTRLAFFQLLVVVLLQHPVRSADIVQDYFTGVDIIGTLADPTETNYDNIAADYYWTLNCWDQILEAFGGFCPIPYLGADAGNQ